MVRHDTNVIAFFLAMALSVPAPAGEPILAVDPAAGITLDAPRPHVASGAARQPANGPAPVGPAPRPGLPPAVPGSVQRLMVVLAAAGLAARPRRRLRTRDEAIDEATVEMHRLLDDRWNRDIGAPELSRAREVVESLGVDGTLAMGRLSDEQLETWIRETRGWVGGFAYNAGSDHLQFLAASVQPAQAARFAVDLIPYLGSAPLANRLAVYGVLAENPAYRLTTGSAVALDRDRSLVLNALAGTGAIQQLMLGLQFRERDFGLLTDPTGLDDRARTDVVLGAAKVLSPWHPGQEVPATNALAGLAAQLDDEVLTELRRHHSPSSSELVPLLEHVISIEGPELAGILDRVAGDPATYADRFNAASDGHHVVAANMGYLMGVAAEATSRAAADRSADVKTVSRVVELLVSIAGAPAGPTVGGGASIAIKEIEDEIASGLRSHAGAVRKHLYYLALPHRGDMDNIDPLALAAYHNAFGGVRP